MVELDLPPCPLQGNLKEDSILLKIFYRAGVTKEIEVRIIKKSFIGTF
jgi:hypothetical protein